MKKNTILFSFEHASLKELRKVLFKRGLSPQEFFSYIIERISVRDDRMDALLSEACSMKQQKLKEGGIDKKHMDADALYNAIEEGLTENKQP
jgi:hypothetical protein